MPYYYHSLLIYLIRKSLIYLIPKSGIYLIIYIVFNNFMLDISHTLVYSWRNEQNTANALTRISRRWCSWAANRESASWWTLTTLNPPESVSEKLTGSPHR